MAERAHLGSVLFMHEVALPDWLSHRRLENSRFSLPFFVNEAACHAGYGIVSCDKI